MTTNENSERRLMIGRRFVVIMMGTAALGGCVQIETPDKPIEINLNINIKQEIVYKLDGDAKKLIEQNSGIF
ncbi:MULTISPECIES: YnbE family lipoprotein [unclassified Sphingopyxis]|jgi:hypothetical protein|uniref:YnbE family lipoprotein n=1 Tax=unclassified Sphingopyxis TaxID=2614943 RepID=UPI0024AE6061|nr:MULTISPECIES: YnbE family lipoprotein [unclassified Sphingopyxis]